MFGETVLQGKDCVSPCLLWSRASLGICWMNLPWCHRSDAEFLSASFSGLALAVLLQRRKWTTQWRSAFTMWSVFEKWGMHSCSRDSSEETAVVAFLSSSYIFTLPETKVWKSLAWNTRVFTNWPCQISPAQIHFLLPFYFSSSYILHSGCPKSWNLPEDTRLFEISEIQYMFFLLEMTFCLILTKSQYTHFWPFPHKPTWKTNFIKE